MRFPSTGLRTLQVADFAANPTLRQSVRQLYREHGLLTIRPTEKGLAKIDEFHPYSVRLARRLPAEPPGARVLTVPTASACIVLQIPQEQAGRRAGPVNPFPPLPRGREGYARRDPLLPPAGGPGPTRAGRHRGLHLGRRRRDPEYVERLARAQHQGGRPQRAPADGRALGQGVAPRRGRGLCRRLVRRAPREGAASRLMPDPWLWPFRTLLTLRSHFRLITGRQPGALPAQGVREGLVALGHGRQPWPR